MRTGKIFKRDFTMVVIGQIISLFGNAMLRFALPLYLLRETDSSSLFGAVTACSFIPLVVFSFLGGVIADRINKRNIMVALDFLTAAIISIFYISLGKLPLVPLMIVVLMLLYGISGAYQPSVQASIPLLVEYEALAKGNATINMVSTLSNLLGPVIGGVLFGCFGLIPILFLSIICFIISAVMEIFIHIPHQKRKAETGVFVTVRNDLKESFRFVKREKPIFLSVVGILALFNLVLSAAMIVGIPVMVVQVLGMSDTDLGVAQGALGLGGLVGGMLAGAVTEKLSIKHNYIFLLEYRDIIIDPKYRTVKVESGNIELTNYEFDILYLLAKSPGQVFSKEQIYNQVWKEPYYRAEDNVMSLIRRIRKKIEPDPRKPMYILTVWGLGYKFNSALSR